MRDVIFFSFAPWWLRCLEGVGAAFDYSRHLFPKFTLDITQPFRAATIFHASCSSAAIASVSFAPYSNAMAATPRICPIKGILVFLRSLPP